MTEYARINIGKNDAGEEVFSQLLSLYPENKWNNTFIYYGPMVHSRTQEILNLLRLYDRKPWDNTSVGIKNPRVNFTFQIEKKYNAKELSSFLFLEVRPLDDAHIFDSPRREDKLMRLLQGYLKEDVDIGFTMPTWYVVPDHVKRVLEEGRFAGIVFRPIHLLPGLAVTAETPVVPWDQYGEPWWELDSDISLPPLSDSMTFTDMNGKILKNRDFSNGFHRRDGLYVHPELHYKAANLEVFGCFDLARTYEPFGNRKGYERSDCPLVASQKFYQFCLKHRIKTNWVPVRIDPD